MAHLRLVDLRNVFDATVDAAVAGLQGLAASLPQQSDAEKCADPTRGSHIASQAPRLSHTVPAGACVLRLLCHHPALLLRIC